MLSFNVYVNVCIHILYTCISIHSIFSLSLWSENLLETRKRIIIDSSGSTTIPRYGVEYAGCCRLLVCRTDCVSIISFIFIQNLAMLTSMPAMVLLHNDTHTHNVYPMMRVENVAELIDNREMITSSWMNSIKVLLALHLFELCYNIFSATASAASRPILHRHLSARHEKW